MTGNERRERVWAVRGAVKVESNDVQAILAATGELMRELMSRNGIEPDQIVSCLFTATDDLNAEFPAVAARELGLDQVPLLCTQELDVPGAMRGVVRVMAHYYAAAEHSPSTRIWGSAGAAHRPAVRAVSEGWCVRAVGRADAAPSSRSSIDCFEEYREFAPAGWEPPPDRRGAQGAHGGGRSRARARAGSWARLPALTPATSSGSRRPTRSGSTPTTPRSPTSGSSSSRRPIAGSGLASRPDRRGHADAASAGLRRDPAADRRVTTLERARFYEREGWSLLGDWGIGLRPRSCPIVEYGLRLREPTATIEAMAVTFAEKLAVDPRLRRGRAQGQGARGDRRLQIAQLASNESPFPPHPAVVDAIAKAAAASNRYPDPDATLLRRRISERFEVDSAQIAVSNGSCEVLLAAALALCEPGAEIVYAWPSFSIYPYLAPLSGAREIRVSARRSRRARPRRDGDRRSPPQRRS